MGVFAKEGLQPTLLDVEICPRPVTYVVWSNCLVAFVELQAMVAAKKFGLDIDDFTGDALHHVAENIQAKKFQNEGGVKRAVWNLARDMVKRRNVRVARHGSSAEVASIADPCAKSGIELMAELEQNCPWLLVVGVCLQNDIPAKTLAAAFGVGVKEFLSRLQSERAKWSGIPESSF